MAGGVAQRLDLAELTLQPGQARPVAIPAFPGGAPEAFNFSFSFNGMAQDVLAVTTSVDATGSYVFTVEPHGVGRSAGVSSVYWTYGRGFDTMYTLWNPLSIAQQAELLLVASDGRLLYSVPVRLAAGATMMVDLFDLYSSGKADAAGRVMPPGPTEGSALLTGPKNDTTERFTIALSGGVYNAASATCGPTCETCDGFTNVSMSPGDAPVEVTSTLQLDDFYTWDTGYQYNYTGSSGWSSSNSSVASVGSNTGLVSGDSPGDYGVTASFGELPVYAGQICASPLPGCPVQYPEVQTGCAESYNLVCGSYVRGGTGSCTVHGIAASEVNSWTFQGSATVTGAGSQLTWSGTVVEGGTVTASISPCGSTRNASATLTVTPRTGWAVAMPAAQQVADGTNGLPTLPYPPTTEDGSLGQSTYAGSFNWNYGQAGGGPNAGYAWVISLSPSASFPYELNPGITNSSDTFYQHQGPACSGWANISDIVSLVVSHEAGSTNSHWAYGNAANSQSNPGTLAEKDFAVPSGAGNFPTNEKGTITGYFNAITSAAAQEPPSNLSGLAINWYPYQPCQ